MTNEIDWEDAFSNGSYIENAESFPPSWAQKAAEFREQALGQLDLAYGENQREVLDLFLPKERPRGLVVFVHGGYWLAFDKSSWSHLAKGPLALGWAVAIPSYVLAPESKIPDITSQVDRAIALAAAKVEGPIRLAGHSAGGHLVARMGCEDAPLPPAVSNRIDRIVSISGLHDLRPLLNHSMNEKLGLTETSARAESPALLEPRKSVDVTAWVGAQERPEFLRQAALLSENWGRKGLSTQLVAEPKKHHFNVIDGLSTADHPLCELLTS